MKKNCRILSRLSILFFVFFLLSFRTNCQVVSRILNSDQKIQDEIPWYRPNEERILIHSEIVDVDQVLENDRIVGRELPRFGIACNTNYSLEHGVTTSKGNYSVWEMGLYSKDALSISVLFENSRMPEDAVMFLYNERSKFIVGPIRSSQFRNGVFRSDYVKGEQVIISVYLPGDNRHSNNGLNLNITGYDHAINKSLSLDNADPAFGSSLPCNVNTVCSEGDGVRCEIDGVCKILHSSIGACTGTLVNNDCCDLSPYILTAEHCTNGFVDDFLFRFNYESSTCSLNTEPHTSQWITYHGSELRSSWDGTDFALLELFEPIESGVSFVGWDRTGTIPTSSTIIHHPRGDVKKITFDNEAPELELAQNISFPANALPNRYVRVELAEFADGDFGVLEGGSSGAAYLDDNGRVYAQHHGGDGASCNSSFEKWAGRLSEAWEGGGNAASNLRNWLGGSTNPNNADCMASPSILGPKLLCTTPEDFTLVHVMPCTKTVSWNVVPDNLFSSSTSGTGSLATLSALANVSGLATLSYTLASNGCSDAVVTHEFWIGAPNFTFNFDDSICVGEFGFVFLTPNQGAPYQPTMGQLTWTFSGSISGSGTTSHAKYRGLSPGWGQICVAVQNDCGTTNDCQDVLFLECDGGFGKRLSKNINDSDFSNEVIVTPNPTLTKSNVSFSFENESKLKLIKVLSVSGKLVYEVESTDAIIEIDLSNFQNGIYFMHGQIDNNNFQKILVKL